MKKPMTAAQRALAYRAEAAEVMQMRFGRVFGSDDGQMVLAYILNVIGRVDNNLKCPIPTDTYYLLGRRDAALDINRLAQGIAPQSEGDA